MELQRSLISNEVQASRRRSNTSNRWNCGGTGHGKKDDPDLSDVTSERRTMSKRDCNRNKNKYYSNSPNHAAAARGVAPLIGNCKQITTTTAKNVNGRRQQEEEEKRRTRTKKVTSRKKDTGSNSTTRKKNNSSNGNEEIEGKKKKQLLIVLYKWNELRVHDNEPLYYALNEYKKRPSTTEMIHLHVIEDELIRGKSRESQAPRCSARRALFWRNSVLDLGKNLHEQFNMPLFAIHHDIQKNANDKRPQKNNHNKNGKTSYHYESVVQVFRNIIGIFSSKNKNRQQDHQFDKIKIFTHDSFCDEEIKTIQKIESLCSNDNAIDIDIDIVTTWGALTVHHIDDLPFGNNHNNNNNNTSSMIDNMPNFKGEFQKAVKKIRIRDPVHTVYDGSVLESSIEKKQFQTFFTQSWKSSYGKNIFCLDGGKYNANVRTKEDERYNIIDCFDSFFDYSSSSNQRMNSLEKFVGSFDPESISQEVIDLEGRKDIDDKINNNSKNNSSSSVPAIFGKSTFLYPPPPQDGSHDQSQPSSWIAGETAALEYLDFYLNKNNALEKYKGATESFNHSDANTPINAGSRLSPYLAFGNLSVRYLMHEVKMWERKQKRIHHREATRRKNGNNTSTTAQKNNQSIQPRSKRLYQELVFRDFLRFLCLKWKTSLFQLNGPFQISDKSYYWRNSNAVETKKLFTKWKLGQTGIPFIDAGLRELALTGYMSHLHRQCCAAYLVRELRIDWRWGAEHFESCLLDHTPDANWGNWSYRILPRPCLIPNLERNRTRNASLCTTAEIAFWPLVHDSYLRHTLAWIPEVRKLRDYTLAREPWRTYTTSTNKKNVLKRHDILPYKDSGFWFCAANRTNWDYEYKWLKNNVNDKGVIWYDNSHYRHQKIIATTTTTARHTIIVGDMNTNQHFDLKSDYFLPLKTPISVDIPSRRLPVKNKWGKQFSEGESGIIFSEKSINLMRQRIEDSISITMISP